MIVHCDIKSLFQKKKKKERHPNVHCVQEYTTNILRRKRTSSVFFPYRKSTIKITCVFVSTYNDLLVIHNVLVTTTKRMDLLSDSKISSIIFLHKTNINFPRFFFKIYSKKVYGLYSCVQRKDLFFYVLHKWDTTSYKFFFLLFKGAECTQHTCVFSLVWDMVSLRLNI